MSKRKKKITKSHPLLLELETSLVVMVYDYSSTYTEFTLDPGPTIPNGWNGGRESCLETSLLEVLIHWCAKEALSSLRKVQLPRDSPANSRDYSRRKSERDPLKKFVKGFLGGTVVKNPPANARDTGSSPGPGRSHMPWSNKARAPQLLSLRSRAREPQLLKPACLEPVLRNKRSHRNEKPAHLNEE